MKVKNFNKLKRKVRNYFGKKYKKENKIFEKCFMNTIETTCKFKKDGSVFVVTGDIPAMWLRDSSAQVMQYLNYTDDKKVCDLIKGVIKRQADFIIYDTYTNAFMDSPLEISEWDTKYLSDRWGKLTWERKFELDSLSYPLFLSAKYYEKTKDKSIFTKEFLWAFEQIKNTIEIERHHSKRSTYFNQYWTYETIVGKNTNPEEEKGLIWCGYRPSDDECKFNYHIPDNMFMVSSLYKLSPIFKEIGENTYAEYCDDIVNELKKLIEKYGVVETKEFGRIYISETDCLGNYHFDDDANIPSLLSIPYLEYPFIDKEIYENTRRLILSKNNKYYYEGKVLHGIGSPHTSLNRVWALSIAMQGITSNNEQEIIDCFNMLINSTDGTGYMHEGIDVDDPSKYSRPWFAWANSLFAEFVIRKKEIIIRSLK